MIEQGIYFALGCIVTALLALLFAPVFWGRALRLTRQRLQLQVPLSMQEILAERDNLRAEFAVERLRIEQAMERVQATKGQDMAELGRRSMEIVALAEQIAALRKGAETQDEEVKQLRLGASEAEAENGALRVALHDGQAELDMWRHRAEMAQVHKERLQDEIDSHRTTIASLKTRGMGLEMRITDAERAFAAREKALESGLRTRLETAVGHVARHENANILLRRELDDARLHIRQLEDQLVGLRGGLDEARERDKAATLQRSLQGDKGRGGENGAQAGAVAGTTDDDAGLRESIHALGVAVARLSRQARDETTNLGGEPQRRAVKDEAPA